MKLMCDTVRAECRPESPSPSSKASHSTRAAAGRLPVDVAACCSAADPATVIHRE